MIGYVLVNFTLPRGKTLNAAVVAYTYVRDSEIPRDLREIAANSVSLARAEESTLRNGSASNVKYRA